MEGMTGRLFREFSIVIAGAVAISSFVALSLTPMLSSKILKARTKEPGRFYNATERFFVRLNNTYKNSLEGFLQKRWLTFLIIGGALGIIFLLWMVVPSEMAPLEDRSSMSISISTAEGATYEYSLAYMEEIADMVTNIIPEEERTGVLAMTRGSSGSVRVSLVPPGERARSQMQIAEQIRNEARKKTNPVGCRAC